MLICENMMGGVNSISDFGSQVQGLNPAASGIHLMTAPHFVAQPFNIALPSLQYDLNNVERDVKHQTIIIMFENMGTICSFPYIFVMRKIFSKTST